MDSMAYSAVRWVSGSSADTGQPCALIEPLLDLSRISDSSAKVLEGKQDPEPFKQRSEAMRKITGDLSVHPYNPTSG